jgi:hypothetical protein
MKRRTRIAALTVAALTATSIAAVAQAPAKAKQKTYSVNKMVWVLPIDPSKPNSIAGKTSGKPFGNGTVKGVITPAEIVTMKVKGGTATMLIKAHISGIDLVGTWKWTKGTGKFKGIKGKGTAKGVGSGANFDQLKFSFKGTAKY